MVHRAAGGRSEPIPKETQQAPSDGTRRPDLLRAVLPTEAVTQSTADVLSIDRASHTETQLE
jgi:hypothetical protein